MDILDCKWQSYQAEEQIKSLLQTSGFEEIEIFYDKAHIFPTIVAKRPMQ